MTLPRFLGIAAFFSSVGLAAMSALYYLLTSELRFFYAMIGAGIAAALLLVGFVLWLLFWRVD